MKKLSVYSVIILVVIVSVFLTSGIVNAQATGSAIKYCPTGYICELIPVLPNCPVGYICKLAGGTPTTSITNTTNTNIGTPLPKPITTCYTFSSNLEIGSVGADVVALQTWLISSGYSIPGISSGSVAKGTFDTETANAVSRYQLSMGFPTTGFFGPLTRQSINNTCNNTNNTTTTNQVPSTNSIIVTNPSIDYKVPSTNSINVVTPKAGDSLIVNIPTQIVWTGNFEKGNELFEIQIFDSNGKDYIATVPIANASCVGGMGMSQWASPSKCSYTWTPTYAMSSAVIGVDVQGIGAIGYSNKFSIINCPSGYSCSPPSSTNPVPVTNQSSATITSANIVIVQPVVKLIVYPSTVLLGKSATVTWSTENITSCSSAAPRGYPDQMPTTWLNPGISGSFSYTPSVSTTLYLTCTGSNGNIGARAIINVTGQQTTVPMSAGAASQM